MKKLLSEMNREELEKLLRKTEINLLYANRRGDEVAVRNIEKKLEQIRFNLERL